MNKLGYYIEWAWDTWFGLVNISGKYNKEWDEKLNQILDTGDFEFGKYVMRYKNYEVWVGNRFVGYGYLFSKDRKRTMERFRPRASTMVRLAMLQDEWEKNNVKTDKQTTLDIIKNIEVGESE